MYSKMSFGSCNLPDLRGCKYNYLLCTNFRSEEIIKIEQASGLQNHNEINIELFLCQNFHAFCWIKIELGHVNYDIVMPKIVCVHRHLLQGKLAASSYSNRCQMFWQKMPNILLQFLDIYYRFLWSFFSFDEKYSNPMFI